MTGVIDVGGGMRDIYGAGVFDWCMEQEISFDRCYGISAGSANITSFLADQPYRNYKFYMEYAFRDEYMSWKNFFQTRNYINLDYVYSVLSNSGGEYPLDYETMAASPSEFIVVATDADTGRPHYFHKKDMKKDNYAPVKGSSCVPIFNKPYPIGSGRYFDGGMTDPIPIRKAMRDGCTRIVVILTRPKNYYRKPKNDIRLARLMLKKYPNAAKAMARRWSYYNRELEICHTLEKEGKVLIVAPDDIRHMSTLKKDHEAMQLMYEKGYSDAEKIREFLEN